MELIVNIRAEEMEEEQLLTKLRTPSTLLAISELIKDRLAGPECTEFTVEVKTRRLKRNNSDLTK